MANRTPIPLTLGDVRDPTGQRLLYFLQQLNHRVAATTTSALAPTSQQFSSGTVPNAISAPSIDAATLDRLTAVVSASLRATGAHPLNVTGLPGALAEPQIPSLLIFTTDPLTTISANLYEIGTLATYNGAFYYVAPGNPHTWGTVTLTPPANMVTTDTNQTITGVKTFTPAGAAAINITAGQINSSSQFSAYAFNSAVQSIPNNTPTALTFDSEVFDHGGIHSTTTNASRITIPTGGAGVWAFVAQATFAANATGIRYVQLVAGGLLTLAATQINAGAAVVLSLNASVITTCVDGDFFEVFVLQNSGGALNVTAGVGVSLIAGHKLA